MTELQRAMRPGKRRLRMIRSLHLALLGGTCGASLALCVCILRFFLPVTETVRCLFLPLAGFVLGGCLGLFLPYQDAKAAVLLDRAGLQERVQTALQVTGQTDMERLLKDDAVQALKTMNRKNIPCPSFRSPLLTFLILTLLCLVLFTLPTPQANAIRQIEAFQHQREDAVEALKDAEAQMEDMAEDTTKEQTRELLRDTQRAIRDSAQQAEALLALSRAEQRLQEIREESVRSMLEKLANAEQTGSDTASGAGASRGDGQTLSDLLNAIGAEGLAEAAQAASGEMQSALQKAAEALETGDAASAADALASTTATSLAQAGMQAARESLSGAGQRAASGSTGSGTTGEGQGTQGTSGNAGTSGGQGTSSSSGSGQGSTNLEGQSSGSDASTIAGNNPYREEAFERIYDPEHIDISMREVTAHQMEGTGEDTTMMSGPDEGSLDGYISPERYAASYKEAAAQAANTRKLSSRETAWVQTYFEAILEDETK